MGPGRGKWHEIAAAVRRRFATPAQRWQGLSLLGVAFVLVSGMRHLFAPMFVSWSTYGFHDWDSHSAYRYATVLNIKRYHEFPWWNPWLAGGFPAWGYVEGATNFISPYLPFYLTLPIQVAERFEFLGATTTGLVSAYLAAGRFTKSAAVRTLVAVVYGLNGRWALQVSTGHSWHMQYAWLPLALYFFDVSLDAGKRRWALASGMVLAIIVYMGGIYPLPHIALVLVVYASAMAVVRRTFEPIVCLAIASTSGIGLSAPKLLPLIDLMMRYPRKIESPEALDLGMLTAMMTERNQSYAMAPIAVPRWGWHEYGIYVGVWAVAAIFLGLVGGGGDKTAVAKLVGLLLLLLGMGAFHANAPWTLLHQVPVFSSQHVPSRFLFPAMLFLMLSFAGFARGILDRPIATRGWVDLVLLVPVYFIAIDIASVGRKTTEHSFYMEAPPIQWNPEFHHAPNPYNYTPGDWAGASLLAMFANIGSVGSYGLPIFVPGAIPVGDARYRGDAYLVGEGAVTAGNAHVGAWTPNTATVTYDHAGPQTLLVYNMNYDPSWKANGVPAVDYNGAAATPIAPGSGIVRFTYYPRMLNWGLLTWAVTVFFAFGAPRLARWRRAAPGFPRSKALVSGQAPSPGC